VRQREKKRLGEERGARAHRSGRKRAVMPAEVRHSDKLLLPSGGASKREKGAREERGGW
jgi:hypothetical protein